MRYLFAVLIGFYVLAGAVSPVSADGACEKARSSADVMKCLTQQYDAYQEQLNQVFDALSLQNSGDDLTEIKDLQASWLDYRDRECTLETAKLETESLKRLENLRCLQRLTQERIEALQRTIDMQTESNALGETAAPPRWMNVVANDHPDVFWSYGAGLIGDLDCDGEDEHVMSGLYPREDMLAAMSVVSIVENPIIGRPEAALLTPDFSVSEDDEVAGADCGLVRDLEIVPAPEEEVADVDEQVDAVEKTSCMARLVITARACERSVGYVWNGQDYVPVVSVSVSDDADE